MARKKEVKVIDLGIRDSMSAQQILAEAAKWNWQGFVLAGWVAIDEIEVPEGETQPSRFEMLTHPETDSGEALILSDLVHADCVDELRGIIPPEEE